MKIIIDDKIPYIRGVLEPFLDIEYCPGKEIKYDIARDADALIVRTRTKCNKELLHGSKIRFIATATIGFDHIDTVYCKENGILWTNAPGCNSGSVMQYIASALLTYAKENEIKLQNRVLGVIGVGNVGKKIVRLAEYLGMQVLLNDPPIARKEGLCGFLSLEGLLRETNIITIHVPLNMDGIDKTYHLVDDSFFSKLNKDTLLINTSRGEVVDSAALKKALIGKNLSAAILDVWENEPAIDKELLELLNIGTPHIAGYSADGKSNATAMVVQATSRFFQLGIDDWVPEDIPEVENKIIHYNAKGKSTSGLLEDIILQTYTIREDDKKLRGSLENFESLRGNYPVRREFGAFTVIARNLSSSDRNTLLKIGFKVELAEG